MSDWETIKSDDGWETIQSNKLFTEAKSRKSVGNLFSAVGEPFGDQPKPKTKFQRFDDKASKAATSAEESLNEAFFGIPVGTAGRAFVHNAAKLPMGLVELGAAGGGAAVEGLAKLLGYGDLTTGKKPVSEAMGIHEASYQRDVPDSLAATIGAIGGNVAPFTGGPLKSGMEKLYRGTSQPVAQTLAKALGPKTSKMGGAMAGSAVTGMAAAPLYPIGSEEDYWNKWLEREGLAGVIGAAAPPVLNAVGWAGENLVARPANWVAQHIKTIMAGPEGEAKNYLVEAFKTPEGKRAAINELMRIGSKVAGERPTSGLASVTGKEPIPVLKALEEGARNRPYASTEFAARDMQNEAARAAPFEAMARIGRKPPAEQGMPQRLSLAEAARANTTGPMYEGAKKDLVPVTDKLQALLSGEEIQPAVKSAGLSLEQAITNANVAGRTPPTGVIPGKTTAGYGLPEWSVNAPNVPDKIEPTKVTIDALQRVKNNMDKMISQLQNANDAAGVTKLAQLKIARTQLDQIMRENSIKWGQAQDTFKKLSEPQNQADVSEVLLNALKSPAGIERETAFGNAVRNAAQTIKKGDVPRFTELGQVFTPQQKKWVDATTESVAREAKYKNLHAPQSILPEMEHMLDKTEKITPNLLNQYVASFRKLLRISGGHLDEKAQTIIDNLMLEPKKLAAFMEVLSPSEKNTIMQYLKTARGQTINSTQPGIASGITAGNIETE